MFRTLFPSSSLASFRRMLACVAFAAGCGGVASAQLTEPVGTISTTQTATVTITTPGTLHTISVLTRGATGLDFKMVSGGSCSAGIAYTAGQTCTVFYTFKPTHPYARYGGISLSDASGNLLGNLYINGTGTGPQAAFALSTGIVPTVLSNAFADPTGIAVDGSGDVYVVNSAYGVVDEFMAVGGIIPANPTINQLGGVFNSPGGIAVDGSGNVYIGTGTTVQEMIAVGGAVPAVSPAVRTLSSYFGSAFSVAVDGSGNVYVADGGDGTGFGTVKEIVAINGVIPANPTINVLGGSNFYYPVSVAVDSQGNVYVGDGYTQSISEIIAVGGVIPASPTINLLERGLVGLAGQAVDGAGNLYAGSGDGISVDEIVAVGGVIPANPTVKTLATGFTSAYGVAVDGSGNVYVTDGGTGTVSELNIASGPAMSFSGTTVNSSSAQQVVTVSNNGNANLLLQTLAVTGDFNLGGAGTTCHTGATTAAGASCGLGVVFAPLTVSSSLTGSVTVTDNTLNATQVIALSGVGTAAVSLLNKTITFPQPATPVAVNSFATLTATASNGDPVTYTVITGSATLSGSTITYNAPGSVLITANSAATSTYNAAPTVAVTVVVTGPNVYAAPTTTVGAISATQTAYVSMTTAGTLSTISVLTQGATGLDFQMISGGTCTVGTPYGVGQACTVEYSFAPTRPWIRYGGIALFDASGNLLGNVYLNGTGTGPQMPLSPASAVPGTLGSGFNGPTGIAVDSSGNVYVTDTQNNALKEIVAVNGAVPASPTIRSLGSFAAQSVAVDGSGNVYVATPANHAIEELVAVAGVVPATSPTIRTLGTSGTMPLSEPYGVAVDGSGDLYIADVGNGNAGNGTVKKLTAVNGVVPASALVTTVGTGYSFPTGVAVDNSGNFYIADFGDNLVKEVTGGVSRNLGSGFSSPNGVAVDGSGNVYVADRGHNAIKEILAVAGVIPASSPTILTLDSGGFSSPEGVAVDGSGNVYVADTSPSAIKEVNIESPPGMSFTTAVGTSSAQQLVTVGNNGNAALTLDEFAATANFNLGGAGTTCSSSSTIAAGGSCGLGVVFAPTTVSASLTGSALVLDNTLNDSLALQTIALSGVSTLGTKTITFPQPQTPVVAGGSALLSAYTSNGDPVTYTVTAGTATLSGSTITYTTAGTVTIAADSAATSTYAAAAEVTATVMVSAPGTVTWDPSTLSIYTGAAIGAGVLDAVDSASGTIAYTSSLLPLGSAVTATAATTLAAGSYTLTATVTPASIIYEPVELELPFTVQNMNVFTADFGGSISSLYNNGTLQSNATTGGGVGAAVDASGYVWSINSGNTLSKFTDTGTLSTSYGGIGLSGAAALAIDGNSQVWIANGNGSLTEVSNAGAVVLTVPGSATSAGSGVAIDSSGNVWVANPSTNTVDEVIGGAAPAETLANAVQTATPGTKP